MKRVVLAALAAVGVTFAGVTTWLALRDPLAALPRAGISLPTASGPVERRSGRQFRRHVLQSAGVGAIGLTVSLPDPLPNQALPVLLVLGGLKSGENNLRHAPMPGANAFAGYDWPLPRKLPRGGDLLRAAPELYRGLLAAPGQIAASIAWLAAQPWADARRISLLAFSLGALVAPAAQRVAQADGQTIGWTVMAYGGTDLGKMLAAHPRFDLGMARPLVETAAGLLLRPLEPGEHLPELSGQFLLIGGSDDQLIPRASASRMRELTPEPKSVVLLKSQHLGTGAAQEALMEEIVELTAGWLIEEGAVNTP